ncbi:MAG TPA: TonB-dependent receptor [Terriglobales bacterium]|nr:TonB-dependent receptor [Terriglobales bacterium]
MLSLLCAFLVIGSLPLIGQERFGNVTGVVTDASGAVVPDVTVTVTNKDTNRTFSAKTRNDGTFNANDLEPGRYSLLFQKTGFSRYEVPDVAIMVGRTINVQAQLKVGGVDQKVEVVEAAPLIDTSTNMVATNVTVEEMDRLPKGRNFQGVAVLAPSVNTGQLEGGFQINGASAAENNYYIDGVSTTSVIDGSSRQNATFDYLQEVQVKTTGLDAEYGGALGGVVSAITKSGGNDFHGEFHYLFSGNKISAGPTERLILDPNVPADFIGSKDVAYFQDPKQKLDIHELGGSFGGPIVKNRMWFYTSFSPRFQAQRNNYQFTDVTPTYDDAGNITAPAQFSNGNLDRSFTKQNWFSKLSLDPTSRIRMNFSFLYTPEYLRGALPAFLGFGVLRTNQSKEASVQNNRLGYSQAENNVTGQLDFTLTNSTLLSVKGGRYFLNYKDTGVDALWQTRVGNQASGIPNFPSELAGATGSASAVAARVLHDTTTRAYVQADLSQVARFLGQHNFKFGVGTQKNINNVNDSALGPLGRTTLYWNQACTYAGCNTGTTTGAYGYYIVEDFATRGTTGANITHIYVQDSWKIGRLVVNPGVRFEKETIPSFRPDIAKYAFQFGFGDKIAPRLGASYDLLGNGKVKISGGWGRYYDWTKYDLARGTFGGDLWHVFYRTLDTIDPLVVNNINLENMPGTNLLTGQYRDRRLPGFEDLDPNVKPMSTESINAGVEWEIFNNMVFTGRYVRNHLVRTIEDMGALDANGDEVYRYGNPGEGTNVYAPVSGATCTVTVAGSCAFIQPKAQRDYDAMELSLNKRFGGGWLGNISYVYSRLYGNYSGLQSTDEIRPPGLSTFAGNQTFFGQVYRSGGNANRYFDLDEALYDAHGNDGLFGRLPTDRPHVLKFYGAKQFKFGTEIGGFFRVMSGTPVTTQVVSSNGIPIYVEGRGDLGRTPTFSQTDLLVAHNVKVGEGKSLRFEFNMLNLFNQKTSMFTWDRYNREDLSDSYGINLQDVNLDQGFDWQSMVNAFGSGALDYRYKKAAIFNPGFSGRFSVKFTF